MPAAKRRLLLLFLALVVFFFIANRGAYQGYFQNDDLDNIGGFTRRLPLSDFLIPLVYPQVFDNNFRPVGHLFYRIMGQTAGLHYAPYIAFLHLLHLTNVVLLFFILKRLEFSDLAACAGALFFAFHMAVFDIFWKPMYVFDLLCGFFCLLALLAYLYDRWLLGLLAMCLAYRSKEVAIALPVVLAAYEFLLGSRRWKRLIPFFAFSLILGVQAIVQNHHRELNDYSLRLDPASVWQCLRFYASRIFLIPYAGFLILLLPFFVRDRRLLFGIAAFCALLVPMLLLPARLYSPYLYVPLIGLSIAASAVAARQSLAVIALFFALWLPWNYVNLRWQRRDVLADARDRRAFVSELVDFNRRNPQILAYIYDAGPLNSSAAEGVVRLAHPVAAPIRFATLNHPDLPAVLQSDRVAVISWNPRLRHLHTVMKSPEIADTAYLEMSVDTPIWQLGDGWYGFEGSYRWTHPYATARITRPENARQFELLVNISPLYISKVPQSHVVISLNGSPIGEHDFTHSGWQTVRWDLPPAPAGPVEMAIRVSPELVLGRSLGIAVGGVGFVAGPESQRK